MMMLPVMKAVAPATKHGKYEIDTDIICYRRMDRVQHEDIHQSMPSCNGRDAASQCRAAFSRSSWLGDMFVRAQGANGKLAIKTE